MGGMFLSLFDEVHRSNMSKACATLKEAEETRRLYRENKDTESVIEGVQDGKWLVFRKSDRKVLKSVRYSPANLVPIVELSSVAEFHTLFRCPVVETPQMPSADRCKLRVSLLQEEVQELEVAIAQSNLIEVADALADIQYVLSGAVLEFGMGSTFQTLFDEVHRSNMSKACATPEEAEETRRHYLQNKKTESYAEQVEPGKWLVYRQGDNKALKSVRYSPANLGGVLIHS
jgi:predicted HAD superfamily Cof-like phosphohydrolase